MSDEIRSGVYYYDSEAQANADIEQARAESLRVLRTATSYSLSAFTPAGKGFHSAVSGQEQALSFLVYSAAKAFRDLTHLIGDADKAHELIDTVLERLEEPGE